MTMTLIETIEVGAGGASSIEFTSIPQDGTDLLCVVSSRSDYAGTIGFSRITVNGGTSLGGLFLRGTGSAVSSSTAGDTLVESVGNTATSNAFSNNLIYISNYTSTSNKNVGVDTVTEDNAAATVRQQLLASSGASGAAITSIKFEDVGDNLMQYSTASL